jgi:hypothetical protein
MTYNDYRWNEIVSSLYFLSHSRKILAYLYAGRGNRCIAPVFNEGKRNYSDAPNARISSRFFSSVWFAPQKVLMPQS